MRAGDRWCMLDPSIDFCLRVMTFKYVCSVCVHVCFMDSAIKVKIHKVYIQGLIQNLFSYI